MKTTTAALLISAAFLWSAAAQAAQIGVAKVDTTPDYPVRMAGYADRVKESEGIAGRLKAAALAIGGDEGEGPAVLVTVDDIAVPADMRAEVLRRIQAKARLKSERFMICSAHIHSGPDMSELPSLRGEQREHILRYQKELTDRLEQVVLRALAARKEGRLDWTQGSVGFAGNRRLIEDGKWVRFGKYAPGPVDHSLPLLRATDANGKLLAVFINYACHNTTLREDCLQLHGDWGGCAQEFIEADHPGAVAMVAIGCGADSDPYPHGTIELCRKHGRAVADEVKRLLAGPMKPLRPEVSARMATFELPYDPLPSMEKLREAAEDSFCVEALYNRLKQGQKPPAAEMYYVAVWAFGEDLAMVFLSDEVVVDYALRLRREFDGRRLWINAYSNDVSFYVASNRLLKEGGYEAEESVSTLITYGHPERLKPSMEDRIVESVRKLLPESFRSPAK